MDKGELNFNGQVAQAIIPALNEEEGIAYTIEELKTQFSDLKILVVDGNSRDNTVHVAKNLGADVVFQQGEGKGDALSFGSNALTAKIST